MKKCSACLKNKELISFWKDERRKDGRYTRCKECMSIKRKSWESKLDYVFEKYQRDAKRRNICFGLNKKEFDSFKNSSCYYCGEILDKVRLDRIDNTLGYFINNVVSCCSICNRFKNSLTKEKFLEHVIKIEFYQRKKND